MDQTDAAPPVPQQPPAPGAMIPIPNIGPRGTRWRLTWGLTTLVLAALLAGALLAVGVPRLWRLAVFPLLYSAGLGVFQARAKT